MTVKSLSLLVVLVIAATLTSGYVSGKLTQRWGASGALQEATARIESFPREIGDWILVEAIPLPEDAIEKLECTAYLNGNFVHRQTGEHVLASLIVGPFGPMSVHTPDVCYPLAGFGGLVEPQKLKLGESSADVFWTAAFQPKELGELPLHVYYAWYHDGKWMAPDWPRFDLGGDPALHKIQVASSYDADGKAPEDHPCYRFLTEFLPVWREQLAKH